MLSTPSLKKQIPSSKNIITSLVFIALSPLTVFAAGDNIVGTPDPGTTGSGLLQGPNTYEFTAEDENNPIYNFYGTSSVEGQWWVGNNSGAPFDEFVPDSNTGSQPSFHVTDDVCAGDEFFMGLGVSNQINGYTSELRMVGAADLFDNGGVGVDVYFGLRNALGTGSPDPADARIDNQLSFVSNTNGLAFQSVDVAPPTGPNNDPVLANLTDEFSWIHYKTDAADNSQILFTVGNTADDLSLTEWVAYFVIPDDGRDCITSAPYTDGVIPTAEEAGLVYSWTVHATDSVGPENPDYDTPIFINTATTITLANLVLVPGTPNTVTADIIGATVDIYRSATLLPGSWGSPIATGLVPGTSVVIDPDASLTPKAFYIGVSAGDSAP